MNMNTDNYRYLEIGGLINQYMCFVFCFFIFKAEPRVSLFSIFMLSLPSLSSGFSFVFSMQTWERYQSQDSGKNANNCVSQSVELWLQRKVAQQRQRCSGRQLNRLEKRRLRESQNMGEGGKKTMEVEMKKGYRGRTGAWEVSEMMKDSQKKCDRVMETKIGKQWIRQIKNGVAECVIVVARKSLTSAWWPQSSSALHLLLVFIWFFLYCCHFPHSLFATQTPCRFCFSIAAIKWPSSRLLPWLVAPVNAFFRGLAELYFLVIL